MNIHEVSGLNSPAINKLQWMSEIISANMLMCSCAIHILLCAAVRCVFNAEDVEPMRIYCEYVCWLLVYL